MVHLIIMKVLYLGLHVDLRVNSYEELIRSESYLGPGLYE
jgi:hypothetical protein